MPGVIESKLDELGVLVPMAAAPAGNYLPWRRSGRIVFIAGQLPKGEDNALVKGKLGTTCSVEQAKDAARSCGINLLSHMRSACGGDLDRVTQILKVEGFVNCTEDFEDHPQVVNGCSNFLVDVFGPAIGAHSRIAVGCSSLPFGAAVEIAAVVEIADEVNDGGQA
eukprot:TRINITY_DN77068_c0_g1_i1.p1 TRINITY_DN77068_c0_g1~~TRINITY_DN77068_c0_g1_i1.p1  ORF type:complete len:166 (-),score=25.26 TRINITY_DN77068_c0_g1_i1:117-614(-)